MGEGVEKDEMEGGREWVLEGEGERERETISEKKEGKK